MTKEFEDPIKQDAFEVFRKGQKPLDPQARYLLHRYFWDIVLTDEDFPTKEKA